MRSLTVRARDYARLYSDNDLLWLQRIVIGRDLGFSLEAIRRWLDDPQFDRRAALALRRAKFAERAERAESMVRAIDAAIAAIDEVVK
jgi:DNA-binding transcriptional MerR regulator